MMVRPEQARNGIYWGMLIIAYPEWDIIRHGQTASKIDWKYTMEKTNWSSDRHSVDVRTME